MAETTIPREQSQPVVRPHAAWQQWQRVLLLVGGLVLMFLGQFQVFTDPNDRPTSGAYILILLGLILFFMALNGIALGAAPTFVVPEQVQRLHIRWRWMAGSFGLAAFAAWRSIVKPQEGYLGEYLLIWGMAMFCFVIAVWPREEEPRQRDDAPLQRWEYGLLVALFLGAFLLRGLYLDKVPPLLDQDEALFAGEGATIRQENFLVTPFEPGMHSHPRLYQALIGVSTALFGQTLPGARMPSAILGALCIPALYLLGREMGGWRMGLVASMFALPWAFHVQFSRLSMNQPGDPLFATLSFYFLLRGLRRGAAADYALSGIMLGIAQLFYHGGRLAVPVMLAYLVWLWLRERPLIARQWRLILIVPLAFFVTTLPQNYYLLYFQQPLSTRYDPNILLGGQLKSVIDRGGDVREYLTNQVRYSFLALVSTNDQGGWYGRGSNLMGPFGGPLLIIGALMSLLILWKHPRWSLPLGWSLAVIVVGSTLSISPPQYQRYYPAVSAFAVLVGMGVMSAAQGIASSLKQPALGSRLALAAGAVLMLANLFFYVGVYVRAGNYLQNRGDWATNRTAREMVSGYQTGRQVVLVGAFATGVENTLVVQFFMSGKKYINVDVNADIQASLEKFEPKKPYLFVVAPERKDDLTWLQATFPGGTTYNVTLAEDGSLAFYAYESLEGVKLE